MLHYFMTSRTHDLGSFTLLNLFIISQSLPKMSIVTAFMAIMACFLGGLFPDIDKPSSDVWDKIPGGSLIGRLIQPFLGAHRHFSHSIVGLIIYGLLFKLLLDYLGKFILVDMTVIWASFMIGVLSHLILDSLTKEGVPWLFPIDIHFKVMNIKTGSWGEKLIVFPGLIIINLFLIYTYYPTYLNLLHNFIN